MGEGLIVRRGVAPQIEQLTIEQDIILSYYGDPTSIPEGFALCDGQNNTPDLRERLVVCTGSDYAYNTTGGFANVIVPQHTHSCTVNTGGNHGGGCFQVFSFNGSDTDFLATGGGSATAVVTSSSGAHTHSISVDSEGVSATNANYPPYMALSFVKKIDATTPNIPSGVIINWSGSLLALPEGWFLCDGENSTPNLKDRFVIGSSTNFTINSTGGNKDAQLGSHTHTPSVANTNSTGAHTHSANKDNGFGTAGFQDGGSTVTTRTLNHAAHTHTITVSSAGVDATDKNLPPFYALAFLMKGVI
jgi:hypothetical protein